MTTIIRKEPPFDSLFDPNIPEHRYLSGYDVLEAVGVKMGTPHHNLLRFRWLTKPSRRGRIDASIRTGAEISIGIGEDRTYGRLKLKGFESTCLDLAEVKACVERVISKHEEREMRRTAARRHAEEQRKERARRTEAAIAVARELHPDLNAGLASADDHVRITAEVTFDEARAMNAALLAARTAKETTT